jgi:hypothetical protein
LDLRELKQQDDGQYCVVRSFVIFTLPADVGAVQLNRTRWMKHVVRMGRCEMPSVFDRKPQVMRPLARTRRRRVLVKLIIEMDWEC